LRFSSSLFWAKVSSCGFSAIQQGSTFMTSPQIQVERRVGQRFPYLLPVSIRESAGTLEGVGITQDLSSRGVFFLTDLPLSGGIEVELTLRMPSEITLGESMRVRCKGRILRVVRPAAASGFSGAESKIGVAVRFECYEYLTERADSAAPRVSALHPHREEDQILTKALRSRMAG
jgi:hypothetical protein